MRKAYLFYVREPIKVLNFKVLSAYHRSCHFLHLFILNIPYLCYSIVSAILTFFKRNCCRLAFMYFLVSSPLSSFFVEYFSSVLEILVFSLLFLGVVAFFTLFERKGMAAVQRREGPNVTGPFGLLQPITDGIKLIFKEVEASDEIDIDAYILAPILSFGISFLGWSFLPLDLGYGSFINSDFTFLLFFGFSSLNIYGLLGAGWASKSKYSLIGSIRGVSQYITYEVFFSLLLIPFLLIADGNFLSIWERQNITWFVFPFFPLLIIFYITLLVETNRAPFDLPEAEAELVAGFNVEYSASMFALFFLGEYNNMLLASAVLTILFFGGDNISGVFGIFYPIGEILPGLGTHAFFAFPIKMLIICYSFVFVRANFPRVRYDQLISLGWKAFLPLCLSLVFLYFTIFVCCLH